MCEREVGGEKEREEEGKERERGGGGGRERERERERERALHSRNKKSDMQIPLMSHAPETSPQHTQELFIDLTSMNPSDLLPCLIG